MPSKATAMQLTLVSHYQNKPPDFARLIDELQSALVQMLGNSFCPYATEQVHGTIIGLEGTEAADGVRNENFLRWRNEERRIDFAGLLTFLQAGFAGFTVRIGGFSAAPDYGFLSQGQHPFLRSFSLQREIAVAIGWPIQDGAISPALDQLRRDLQRFGVLHKWHRQPDDVDNDFFFVLGRVNEALRNERRSAVERELREQLARRKPLDIVVAPAALSFVGYHDPQLPLTSSPSARLSDPALTSQRLREMYAVGG